MITHPTQTENAFQVFYVHQSWGLRGLINLGRKYSIFPVVIYPDPVAKDQSVSLSIW
jgi:hypothetical protein